MAKTKLTKPWKYKHGPGCQAAINSLYDKLDLARKALEEIAGTCKLCDPVKMARKTLKALKE